MTLTQLNDWLLTEGVKPELDLLAKLSLQSELDGITFTNDLFTGLRLLDWQPLLLAGSFFARSVDRAHQEAALTIATAAVSLETEPEVRDAGALIFEKLSNHRSVVLAEKRFRVAPGLMHRLGLTARLEAEARRIRDSVLVQATGDRMRVNSFQKRFWDAAAGEGQWLSVSAPTASGKTFLVLQWVLDRMVTSNTRLTVYLAPTRALVTEIEGSLQAMAKACQFEELEVTSLPLPEPYERAASGRTKAIFVFTQERLHLLANLVRQELKVDLLVVDEAHKVGDTLRGVILQDAVERVTRANPRAQTIFISPATQNPEVLLEDAPAEISREPIQSDAPTVLQNIVLATQVSGQPTRWSLDLRKHDGQLEGIGHVELKSKPGTIKKRLAYVGAALGGKGGTLIYANGAAEAESVAQLVSQLVGSPRAQADPEMRALADLARKGVHRKYLLAPLAERGVGFHYGNMPSLLRLEIERLFRNGKLRFLVCTSTLVEGVNLSCRNIVLRGPRKGRGKPMEPHDFWNLAGRAGRWGTEFQGNIICVDPNNIAAWPLGVPARAKFPIRRETDVVLDRGDELVSFIRRRRNLSSRELAGVPQLEQVGAYLVATYLRDETILDAPFVKRHDADTLRLLEAALQDLTMDLRVPSAMATRHPGVSAVGIHNLLGYFESRKKPVEDLLPAPVESEDAYARMIQILNRINAHIYPAFRAPRLHALIIVEWLQGRSLAAIIAARIKHMKKREQEINLPQLIRSTMELVEEVARFRAPKYVSAYMDALRLHLTSIGQDDLLTDEMDIGVALEFGVSSRTLLSLIQLGLSRMAAVELYEAMTEDNLDQDGCRAWVEEHEDELNGMDLPILILNEIRRLLLDGRSGDESLVSDDPIV
jgi:hypothetical protein